MLSMVRIFTSLYWVVRDLFKSSLVWAILLGLAVWVFFSGSVGAFSMGELSEGTTYDPAPYSVINPIDYNMPSSAKILAPIWVGWSMEPYKRESPIFVDESLTYKTFYFPYVDTSGNSGSISLKNGDDGFFSLSFLNTFFGDSVPFQYFFNFDYSYIILPFDGAISPYYTWSNEANLSAYRPGFSIINNVILYSQYLGTAKFGKTYLYDGNRKELIIWNATPNNNFMRKSVLSSLAVIEPAYILTDVEGIGNPNFTDCNSNIFKSSSNENIMYGYDISIYGQGIYDDTNASRVCSFVSDWNKSTNKRSTEGFNLGEYVTQVLPTITPGGEFSDGMGYIPLDTSDPTKNMPVNTYQQCMNQYASAVTMANKLTACKTESSLVPSYSGGNDPYNRIMTNLALTPPYFDGTGASVPSNFIMYGQKPTGFDSWTDLSSTPSCSTFVTTTTDYYINNIQTDRLKYVVTDSRDYPNVAQWNYRIDMLFFVEDYTKKASLPNRDFSSKEYCKDTIQNQQNYNNYINDVNDQNTISSAFNIIGSGGKASAEEIQKTLIGKFISTIYDFPTTGDTLDIPNMCVTRSGLVWQDYILLVIWSMLFLAFFRLYYSR